MHCKNVLKAIKKSGSVHLMVGIKSCLAFCFKRIYWRNVLQPNGYLFDVSSDWTHSEVEIFYHYFDMSRALVQIITES